MTSASIFRHPSQSYLCYFNWARANQALKASWTTVYEAWKELSNALIRGYSSGGFEAWTVPCLYVTGKYLRIFAIKADQETGNKVVFGGGFQDDFNPEAGKNEKLEDAARVLNRIFQLCISDRYVVKKNISGDIADLDSERRSRNQESGASTILLTSSSRPISSLIPFLSQKIFSEPFRQVVEICQNLMRFQSLIKSHSNITLV